MESNVPMESLAELKKRVQEPVRKYNDVAGVLVGDRVSIHFTRLFVSLGMSPTIATLSMLVFGVAGSLLVLGGGWFSVLGFACVFLYYVFDCVDGEVARYHTREKLIWGYYDFLIHLAVKSTFFVCLGIYAARATGEPAVFLLGLSSLLALLFQKFLLDLPVMLVCRYVLLSTTESRERFARQITDGAEPAVMESDGDLPGEQEPFSHQSALQTVRAVATNFDLATLFFLAAALADVWVPPFEFLWMSANVVTVLVCFYGIVLPIDFLDRLISHVRKGMFRADAQRLLRRAHHFRLPR